MDSPSGLSIYAEESLLLSSKAAHRRQSWSIILSSPSESAVSFPFGPRLAENSSLTPLSVKIRIRYSIRECF